ncbi:MAG: flavodoxin domain-containing protein [Acidimicrobiales bacterium]
MSIRVAVIPTSKYGGTAEIGQAVAETLRARGIEVDISQPEDLFDLSPYAAYIIGSGLYMGRWIDRAAEFVDEYHEALSKKPTWLFSSGPLGPARPQSPVNPDLVDHLMNTSGARDHRLFSGRLEVDKLSRTERFIAKWVGATDGDYREWAEIEAWCNSIADELMSADDRLIDAKLDDGSTGRR